MPRNVSDGMGGILGGGRAGRATQLGAEVKGGRITRPAMEVSPKPKYKKVTRGEALAPPKGVKGKNEALYSNSVSAREAALSKAKTRAQNKAAGLPANYGMSPRGRAMGSTKRMTIVKAEPRYQSPGGNSSGGFLQKISPDLEKR